MSNFILTVTGYLFKRDVLRVSKTSNKKHKMKKVATFFAIAAVVALSACGSKSTEETSTAVDTTAVVTEETPAAMDTMATPAPDSTMADTTAH